ncbi:MAG: hypothetical protein ACLRPR_02535 [Eisenbergiella sp.]
MERKRNFNDGWYFHPGKMEQVIAEGRSKCGVCGGPSNATNEEGRFYPLPERFWAILDSQEKSGECLYEPCRDADRYLGTGIVAP